MSTTYNRDRMRVIVSGKANTSPSVEGTYIFCVVWVYCSDCSYLLENLNQQFSDGNQGEGKLESKWIWIESMNPCT